MVELMRLPAGISAQRVRSFPDNARLSAGRCSTEPLVSQRCDTRGSAASDTRSPGIGEEPSQMWHTWDGWTQDDGVVIETARSGQVEVRRGLQPATPHRIAHERRAAVKSQLLHGARLVGFYRLDADAQPSGD